MATLDPFRGWLVTPAAAPRVVAPAYDSLSAEERARTADANPDSFLNVTRSPEDQVPGREVDHGTLLRTARATLERLLREGAFHAQPRPGYRILRMHLGQHVQTGIVGTVPVADIGSVVRLHEETRADKEDDLVRHLEVVGVSSSPVGLVHRGPSPVADLVEGVTAGAPDLVTTSDDGLEQRVWTVDEPTDVAAVHEGFAAVPALYLTDGHHRAAAAVRHAAGHRCEPGPRDRLLVVAFPAGELRLEPYHRAVREVGRGRVGEVLAAIRERFEVEPVPDGDAPAPPSTAGTFALHLDGRWFTVRARPDPADADPVAALDVTVLQERILAPVFGIADPRSDGRLEFVPGPRGLVELVRRAGDAGAAFALPPTQIGELLAVADAGAVMPPKSTWFEPKVRSGMFLHPVTPGWDEQGLVG